MRGIQLGIRDMDSGDAQQSWVPYHPPRDDCSQGFCSIYCPQWCYIIFPPPPPPETIPSSSTFSPLVIAFIGILASVFLLVIYYAIISKYFSNHHTRDAEEQQEAGEVGEEGEEERRNQNLHAQTPRGLDEAVIRSIAKYRYRKLDALVCCTDCSVCLTEFAEGEVVRLLPKCGHAFHVSCIDMWLKSHSNCPLCRNHVVVPLPTPVMVAPAPPSPEEMVVVDVETQERTSAAGEEETGAMPDHAKFTRVADVLEMEEVEDQESDSGVGRGGSGSCSRWRENGALHCVVMRRSSSSPGRLMKRSQEEVGNNGNIDNDQYRRRHCYQVD